MISTLMFATLAIAVLVAGFLLTRHLSRHDRHPMADQRERNIGEIRRGDPPAT